MTVYIELVFADNFAVTFLLAKLSYRFLQIRAKVLRMIIASLLGATAALLSPLICGVFLTIFFKLVCGVVISLILFCPKNIVKRFLIFFILTFAFGGCIFAVGYFVHGSVRKALTEPFFGIPIGLSLLLCYIMYVIVKVLLGKMLKRRDMRCYLYDAEIKLFGESVRCKAFLDSGNRLYDESSGLPIVVASIGTLSNVLSDEMITKLLTGKLSDFDGAHYVNYATLGGKARMPVFCPDSIVVYTKDKKNIINDVMLGVSFKKISDAESYGLILNPAVMKE